MGYSTVFPEMVMGFAETVTHAVEVGESNKWSEEDARQITAACRETGDKFRSLEQILRLRLTEGVNAATFLKEEQLRLARLDKLLSQHAAALTESDRLQRVPSEALELIAAFEELGKTIARFRDLLKTAISKMNTPRRPVDWQRVQEAQAAFGKGETKPLDGTPDPDHD
jgi:hypothetical protein